MALISLILIGGLIGWFAAILTRTEDVRGIRRYLLLGLAGALIGGYLANNGVVLGGLSWIALVAGIAGAIAAPVTYDMVQRRRSA